MMEILDTRLDRSRFVNARSNALCVDGTSCCLKSSILEKTTLTIYKTQRYNSFDCPDTYAPSTIGYICASLVDLRNFRGLADRTPCNTLEWNILWKLMESFETEFGNVSPTNEKWLAEKFDPIVDTLAQWVLYKKLRSEYNALAIIDTDVERVDDRRRKRNESSDAQRSEWKFYTALQNRFYERLYPGACINLVWFSSESTGDIVDGIASWLRGIVESLNYIVEPLPPLRMTQPLVRYRHRDASLQNVRSYVYREHGRRAVKRVLGQEVNEEPIVKFVDV